ncbi:hypothetical protein NDU88_005529 [Pleurodeles waltl]|uniref:Secreted protein n=1 Tax=Pleurodeles waltl TaxID=8319 RepID=A0AAV7QF14_PLEWA|nr:hypothetical protein NDU88_005529 [Pleurodeles waltl]
MLNLVVPLAPAAPTTLLVFPFIEGENRRVAALSGSRDSFPGALPILALPGFPRRGILAEPFLARRISSAARPQCRSLPASTSPGAWICRVSEFRGIREAKRGVGRHIQPITVAYACHAPKRGGSVSSGLRPLRNPPCPPLYHPHGHVFVLK